MDISHATKLTRLPLNKLRPNALQRRFQSTTTDEEDASLAADIRHNGQRDAIHVLPPRNKAGMPAYTILDGHRRAEALKTNGETEAVVIIRSDLVDVDAAAVEAEFLRFNLLRRQLHPLDQARIAVRLIEIEKGTERDYLRPRDQEELRDRVGKILGMSGRNLDRYLRLLRTPVDVQNAVRDGRLGLVDGGKVDGLTRGQQTEIAERITNGEKPRDVVREFIGLADGRHRKPLDAFTAFVRDLERGLDDLDGRFDKIHGPVLAQHYPVLHQAHEILGTLLGTAASDDADDTKEKMKETSDRLRRRTS